MQIDKKLVGTKIYNIRKQNGYTMEEFGKQLGNVAKGTINSWEKGVNLPNEQRLELIAFIGNTTVNELLHGSLNEYIVKLIHTNLGIKILDEMKPFVDLIREAGYSYGDDMEILRFAKGILNANQIATSRPALFYLLISKLDNLFIGYLQESKDNNVPYFYAFSDTKNNLLHLVPFTIFDTASKYYSYPENIVKPGEHDFFTSGLIALNLKLRGLKMVYYGVDTKKKCLQLTKFIYDVDSDSFMSEPMNLKDSALHIPFVKCIKKELLFWSNK